jgi:hypothetical protein
MTAKEAAIFWLKMPKEKRDTVLAHWGHEREFDGHTYSLTSKQVKAYLEGYAMHLLVEFSEAYRHITNNPNT